MKVLVACEFSGIVRDAFAARGHNAWSVDLLPTERPGQHIIGDALDCLDAGWDLMIAHPPCTLLARAGARWWAGKEFEQRCSLNFVQQLMEASIQRIAIENPPGKVGTAIRPADQYIQPWQHGHGEVKMTGLWLKGLQPLRPSNVVDGRKPVVHHASPGPERWKVRSRTPAGIAAAMAEQWGA